jgi:hypothetical protein
VQGQRHLLEIVGVADAAAASRTFWTAGRSRPMRTAMMATTTNSSIKVKASRDCFHVRGSVMSWLRG